jgi:hypothetical protein
MKQATLEEHVGWLAVGGGPEWSQHTGMDRDWIEQMTVFLLA